jgi:hypothetical protein
MAAGHPDFNLLAANDYLRSIYGVRSIKVRLFGDFRNILEDRLAIW